MKITATFEGAILCEVKQSVKQVNYLSTRKGYIAIGSLQQIHRVEARHYATVTMPLISFKLCAVP